MRLAFTLIFIGLLNSGFTQTVLYNNGTVARMNPGCIVYVKNGDVKNNSGIIKNAGEFTIENDFINNDTATAGNASGLYKVQGDFINNDLFIADQGEVLLYGGTQQVSGSAVTSFYDLALSGSGIKSLGINARVTNTLDLSNLELATGANTMHIDNTSVNAIINNGGFVSSTGNGRLAWSTLVNTPYYFPVGSSLITPRIRPVTIRPVQQASNIYAVRFANTDPSLEGYDRSQLANNICGINDRFYHLIDRTSGTTPADISIYYDDVTDGSWAGIAHWQNVPRWENTGTAATGTSGGYDLLSINNWNNFSFPAFALINYGIQPVITVQGNTLTVSPAGISYEWYFNGNIVSGFNSQSFNTTQSGTYYVIVNYGNGCNGQAQAVEFSPSAINDIEGLSDFHLYPNPGSDFVFINGKLNNQTDLELHFTDMLGQYIMLPRKLAASNTLNEKIDVSRLANGVYFITLISENGRSSLRFIKN